MENENVNVSFSNIIPNTGIIDLVKTKTKKIISSEQLIHHLSKPISQRSRTERSKICSYLAENYKYFEQFKDDPLKFDKLINIINVEEYSPDDTIIRLPSQGDKFYILLQGTIAMYQPTFVQKEMCLGDFLRYIKNIKYSDTKFNYDRIKKQNDFLKLNIDNLIEIEVYLKHKRVFDFFIEEQQKVNEMTEGYTFGEIPLMKNTKSNGTIIAQTHCFVASIELSNYYKVIHECEEKMLENALLQFKKKYALFRNWNLNLLLKLFKCFTQVQLSQGEYVYKQGEEPDGIYILESGAVEIFCLISYDWINELYEYIIDSKSNLLYLLSSNKTPLKENELEDYIESRKETAMKSPFKHNPLKPSNIIVSYPKKRNIIDIKYEEEKYLNPYNLIKAVIKTTSIPEVFGFVECLEIKQRLTSIKITSSSAVFNKVELYDFYRLINLINDKGNREFMMNFIAETKLLLNQQLIRQVTSKKKIIENLLDYKYDLALSTTNFDPLIQKVCQKIKGFGKYDRDSVDFKVSNNRNRIQRHQIQRSLPTNHGKLLKSISSIHNSQSISPNLTKQNNSIMLGTNRKETKKKLTCANFNLFSNFLKTKWRTDTPMCSPSIINKTKPDEFNNDNITDNNRKLNTILPIKQGPSLRRRHYKLAFSNPIASETENKKTTITSPQQTIRYIHRYQSSNSNMPNMILTKHCFITKDYSDILSNNSLKKCKSTQKIKFALP